MRITANTSADNSLFYIQQGRAKLDKLAELIASGQNVNRPSDDPISTNMILGIADKLKTGDQYLSNIDKTKIQMQITGTALQGMYDTLKIARDLANSLVNGSTDTQTLNNAVSQFQTLKQQMIDYGNVRNGETYLFAGADSMTAPFSGTAPYYGGDETTLNINIADSSTIKLNIPGNQILTADTAVSQPYGSTNILEAFDNLITAVGANDVAGINAGAQALIAGAKQVNNAQTDIATRQIRLNSMEQMNSNNRNTLLTVVGDIQTVDYAKLGVELTQQQTAFNASLSATAKLTQMSLLDYIS
ncbi:MAG TPA: flagellar hook-associated protein FlgL [Deltaproteobacteria bacterium]|nr:flagellar hook-associated protein FlgL [Deltaproteobacteria bacterium]HQB37945.1 flagellar hook-associated protein FlgL [Deltaproteobacteria bacterium]